MVSTNQKPIIDIHTTKRETNANVTLKIIIESQGKRAKREQKRTTQPENNKQNGNTYIPINNYFKCNLTKCSN